MQKEFDTLEEAFANIPIVLDAIYDLLNGQGYALRKYIEYYEQQD